jgi:hypothetical protein
MNVDGKTNVKERIKIFESDDFITYLYKFENGNQYTDTVSKWKQKVSNISVRHIPEDRLNKKYWEMI